MIELQPNSSDDKPITQQYPPAVSNLQLSEINTPINNNILLFRKPLDTFEECRFRDGPDNNAFRRHALP